jgi:cytochrome P450
MNALPDSLVGALNPPLGQLLQLQRDLRVLIQRIRIESKQEKLPEEPTIFHELLASDMPEHEKSDVRLADDAQLVIGGGLLTTAWTLSNATFYIVNNPQIQETLRTELREAFPDLTVPDALSWQALDKLPYLRGCIREGIRFAHGLSGRNPRVLKDTLVYDRWSIPAGTPISMTPADVHFDEAIYSQAHEFQPERWLGNPKAPDGSPLERYFVGFGKGPRACIGIK